MLCTAATAQYGTDQSISFVGGPTLVVSPTSTTAAPGVASPPRAAGNAGTTGGFPDWLRRRRGLLLDIAAIVVAALDVALVIPDKAQLYSWILSSTAVAALAFRHRFPFLVTLLTIPGFVAGWAELAPMIALGTLAWKRSWGWQMVVAAIGVWVGRFVEWPLSDFQNESWREHALDAIYACFVIGMPIAIGFLVTARKDLAARLAQLNASREREQRLQAIAVRADERSRIAREMHDVVSHQVSLIAMQAGALQVSHEDERVREVAGTIRKLSARTLDELRDLVSALRTAIDGEDEPDLDTLLDLVRESAVKVRFDMDLGGVPVPGPVAGAAYRTVQEALTNIRKHAFDAPATVRVAVVNGELSVEVHNDPPAPARQGLLLPSGGHGLIGLRERAALLGGRFEAAPTEPGGFRVHARFPLPPA